MLSVGPDNFPVPHVVSFNPAAMVEWASGLSGLLSGPGKVVGVLHPRILIVLFLEMSAVPRVVLSQKRSRGSQLAWSCNCFSPH